MERFAVDLTALTRANAHLREQLDDTASAHSFLLQLLEQVASGVTVQDRLGRMIYANAAAARLFGFASGAELAAAAPELQRYVTLNDPLGQPISPARLFQAPSAGGLAPHEPQLVEVLLQGGGESTWTLLQASSIADPAGQLQAVVCTWQDVSRDQQARRRLEDQLVQVQKMESIGMLALGIAHDFNNVLTTITGFGELLHHALGHDAQLKGDVEQILGAVEHGALLARQLLTFARKQPIVACPTDVNQVLVNLEKLIRRLVGSKVQVYLGLDPGAAVVQVDAGRLDQVVLNLVINARDAMAEGGMLRLTTTNLWLDHQRAGALQLAPGHYVAIDVADSGHGIAPAHQPRIFDPFFTTKGEDKGTGLGLSTSYGILRQFGGSLVLERTGDSGTTLRIYLQATPGQAPPARPDI